jgi:hypothetical protein
MFFEEYSSKKGRGLRWLFEEIAREAAAAPAATQPSVASLVTKMLDELEVRSLVTNLTKMVPPDSSSMAKVREALPVSQADLDAAFKKAKERLKALEEQEGSAAARSALVSAAQGYAELYKGTAGSYLEAGCTEFFPKDKPYSGPRLDKRCILRCMARGRLQGGPTADVLVLLALLLFLEPLDTGSAVPPAPTSGGGDGIEDVEPAIDGVNDTGSSAVCCSLFSPSSACSSIPKAPNSGRRRQLPLATRALFRLEPGLADKAATRVFVARLAPEVQDLDKEVKRALAPLVDEAISAVAMGARRLREAGPQPSWGTTHTGTPQLTPL